MVVCTEPLKQLRGALHVLGWVLAQGCHLGELTGNQLPFVWKRARNAADIPGEVLGCEEASLGDGLVQKYK